MNPTTERLILRSMISQGDYAHCETIVDAEKLVKSTVLLCAEFLNLAAEVHNQSEQDTVDRAARQLKVFFGVDND